MGAARSVGAPGVHHCPRNLRFSSLSSQVRQKTNEMGYTCDIDPTELGSERGHVAPPDEKAQYVALREVKREYGALPSCQEYLAEAREGCAQNLHLRGSLVPCSTMKGAVHGQAHRYVQSKVL